MTWFVSILIAVIIVGFVFGAGYWLGKDQGSDDVWAWRSKYREEHSKLVLAEQKVRGLQSELEFFYPPKSVWNNERADPDRTGG